MTNKTNKRKGYALVMVMVLSLIMSITVVSTFTIVMRYMFNAKEDLSSIEALAVEPCGEEYYYGNV